LDHCIKTEAAEIRDSANSPKHWRHRADLRWSKGELQKYLQRFRRLNVFTLERKKPATKTTHTKHTNYGNHMLALEYVKVLAMHLK